MLSSTAITKVATFITSSIDHAILKINNIDTTVAIHSTNIANNILYVYVWLDDSIQGSITNVKLIDNDGDIFAEKVDSINKDTVEGILVSFKFTLSEVS